MHNYRKNLNGGPEIFFIFRFNAWISLVGLFLFGCSVTFEPITPPNTSPQKELSGILLTGTPSIPVDIAVPPSPSVGFGSKLYFVANDSAAHSKLFASDGTTLIQVTNLNPGGNDNVSSLVVMGNRLFFSADTSTGRNLYSTDGTDRVQEEIYSTDGTDLMQHYPN